MRQKTIITKTDKYRKNDVFPLSDHIFVERAHDHFDVSLV